MFWLYENKITEVFAQGANDKRVKGRLLDLQANQKIYINSKFLQLYNLKPVGFYFPWGSKSKVYAEVVEYF